MIQTYFVTYSYCNELFKFKFFKFSVVKLPTDLTPSINPFTPRSDQYINSPFNFNTLSSGHVMRIKKIIN